MNDAAAGSHARVPNEPSDTAAGNEENKTQKERDREWLAKREPAIINLLTELGSPPKYGWEDFCVRVRGECGIPDGTEPRGFNNQTITKLARKLAKQ